MAKISGSKKVPGKTISQGSGGNIQVEQLEKSISALSIDVKNALKRIEALQDKISKLNKATK